MNNSVQGCSGINRQHMNSHSEKPKMLIVDDEPDNLDLLYRTFRKDFQVLRAESGIKALEVLATEGEVAIIISDQRMPEMKGTEFLSRTVPKFPNTMRIILTGFTDVEDLVEAINSGQVYKYITKPWDPNELKAVVQRATETYQLLKQRTEELQKAQVQTALLSAIIRLVQRSSSIESSLTSIAELLGKSFAADICVLQRVAQARLLPSVGVYATGKVFVEKLVKDPLTARAIATKTIQIATNVDDEEALSQLEFYSMTGIKSHLVIPVILQTEILAMLSIQWQQPHLDLTDYELTLLNLYAQQIALVLICQGILCPDV